MSNNNAARAMNKLQNSVKNLSDKAETLGANIANMKKNTNISRAGVEKTEKLAEGIANSLKKSQETVEELERRTLRSSTKGATRTRMLEQKKRYNTKLKGFMSVRDPSKRYSNANNAALKDRAGQAVYGKGYWNSTKHAPTEGWPSMEGGKRRGRTRKNRKSRKSRKGRKGTRRH